MARAITFTQQANGDYVNRETGAMFQRYQNGWRAFRPAMTSTGYVGLCTVVRNMTVARQVATKYAADRARTEIAKAYDEALAEDADRGQATLAANPNRPSNPLTIVAAELTQTMQESLLYGHHDSGSATVLGSKATRAALRRRGLIAEDNRWTARGREVASIIRDPAGPVGHGHIKTMDELHADALAEGAKRVEDGATPVAWAGRTFGQLTPAERRQAVAQAATRVQAELNHPAMAAALGADLDGDPEDSSEIERAAYAQNRAWVERHDLLSGRPEHVNPAIEADHAEALRLNPDFRRRERFQVQGRTYRVVDVQPVKPDRASVALAVVGETNTTTAVYADILIDWAHCEAIAEDTRWEQRRIADKQWADTGWIGRIKAFRERTGCGLWGARQGALGELHDEAIAEAEQRHQGARPCTKASGWLDEHVAEHDPIELNPEGYDEYERCGARADDPIHVEGAHAEALAEDERRYLDEDEAWSVSTGTGREVPGGAGVEGTAFADFPLRDEARTLTLAKTDAARIIAGARAPESGTSWHIDGKLTEPQPGDLVRITRVAMHSTARRMQWKVVEFAADRKRVRVDLVAGSLLGPQWENWCDVVLVSRPGAHAGSGLPPVPENVDDEAAWAAYCERLPEPTEAQRLATAREYGPYAVDRAEAVAVFHKTVDSYRRQRAEQPSILGEKVLANLRRCMRNAAETVRLYDQLTEAWLTGEGVDSARDAFRQSF